MNEKPVLTAAKNRLPVRPMLIGSSLYSATIVGIATFVVGLIIWPPPRIERTTDALIELDATELEEFTISKATVELDSTCNHTLDEEKIAQRMVQVSRELNVRPKRSPQEVLNQLSVRVLEDATTEKATVARMTLRGNDSEFNHRLLVLLANDLAIAWQQTLVEIPGSNGIQMARSTLLDLADAYEQLHLKTLQVGDLQFSDLQTTLEQAGIRDATRAVSFPVSQSQFQQDDSDSSIEATRQVGLIQQSTADELKADQQNKLAAANPELALLYDQRDRVSVYCKRIQTENQWSETHPEVKPLTDQLAKLDEKISLLESQTIRSAEVSRRLGQPTSGEQKTEDGTDGYPAGLWNESDKDSEDASSIALMSYSAQEGGQRTATVVENEHFQPASTEPAEPKTSLTNQAPIQIPFGKIRTELEQPLNDLSAEMRQRHEEFVAVLDVMPEQSIGSLQLKHGKVRLMQSPRTYVSGIDRKWKWRFIGLLSIATLAASAFSFGMGVPKNNAFSNPSEIENQLGIPVIGVIASNRSEIEKRELKNRYMRWGVRTGEVIIVAALGLVFLSILFSSQSLSDMVANPFVGLSECLNSMFRG